MWLFVVGGLVMVDYSCIVVVGLVIVEFLLTVGDCCCCGIDGLEITYILLIFSPLTPSALRT